MELNGISNLFIIRFVSWWKHPFLDFPQRNKHFKDNNYNNSFDILLNQSPFNKASEMKYLSHTKASLLLG